MNKDTCKGFLAGLLSCVLIFVLIACGGKEDENRLTKKNKTSSALTPGAELTPAASLTETGYQEKLDRIAAVLDYYYYQDIDYNKVADGIYHGAVSGPVPGPPSSPEPRDQDCCRDTDTQGDSQAHAAPPRANTSQSGSQSTQRASAGHEGLPHFLHVNKG